jgi:hypothetical protein
MRDTIGVAISYAPKRKLAIRRANISAPIPSPIQKSENAFPAWRMPNGTINASDTQLEESSSSCERWAWGGAGLVIAAVIAEFAIAICHPPYDSFFERWGSALADLLIAAGIGGEVIFAMMGTRCQTELRRRSNDKVAAAVKAAGEANDRAAKAELETEKLRIIASWRALAKKQHESLVIALRAGGSGASVRFCVLMNDQESLAFAHRIAIPFRTAGWAVGYRFESYTHNIMTGLMLPEPRENWLEEMKVVNGRVRDAFMSAEIDFVNGWPLEPYVYTDDNTPLSAPIASVYVGPKHPPML